MPYLQRGQAQYDRWANLLRHLPAPGLLLVLADDALLERFTAAMIGEGQHIIYFWGDLLK